MGIKKMQGVSAFLEYLPHEKEKRRSKKRCIYFKNGICKCSNHAYYMCKCSSPTHCEAYKEK